MEPRLGPPVAAGVCNPPRHAGRWQAGIRDYAAVQRQTHLGSHVSLCSNENLKQRSSMCEGHVVGWAVSPTSGRSSHGRKQGGSRGLEVQIERTKHTVPCTSTVDCNMSLI